MVNNNHINDIQEAVQGAQSIRAYNVTDRFIAESARRVDVNQECYYPSICANRYGCYCITVTVVKESPLQPAWTKPT